jgi:hypothetical protein
MKERGWGGNVAQPGTDIQTFKEQGRFPANLLVSDDVLNDGRVTSNSRPNLDGKLYSRKDNTQVIPKLPCIRNDPKDSGSFSRYFDLDRWWTERIKLLPESVQRTFPFLIVPKAGKGEKNKGLNGLEKEHQRYGTIRTNRGEGYTEVSKSKNNHPTVKPLKLMSYLITLGSREGDIILDPFGGSGTTALACKLLGRKCLVVEIEEQYCEIAANRCRQRGFDNGGLDKTELGQVE